MKKVVSFSGGRTSAKLVLMCLSIYGKNNVDVVYMDTGAEHPLTYKFINDLVNIFGVNVTCLRGDFDQPLGVGVGYNVVELSECKFDLVPFKAMMEKYGVPYIGGMFCTDRMKLTPYKKYCDDMYPKRPNLINYDKKKKKHVGKYFKQGYETWLGIRSDEPKRYLGEKTVNALYDYDTDEFIELFETLILNKGDVRGEFDIFNGMWCDEKNGLYYDKKTKVENIIQTDHRNKTKNNLHYMVEISKNTKQDVLNWWKERAFDLEIDEWLGNCVFCPKKSNLKLVAAQRDEPALYAHWLNMLYSNSVRVDDNTGHYSKMYRGKQSLESLIATFDGSTGAEIKARIRGTKSLDTNSCSESCEVFQ